MPQRHSQRTRLNEGNAGKSGEMGVGSNQLGIMRSSGRVNDRVSHGQIRIQARFGGQSSKRDVEGQFAFVEREGMRQKKFRQGWPCSRRIFL